MTGEQRAGFTLMEVVVAMAVAAIAMVGLLRLHILSVAAADKADKTAQALVIAQNKIAELEAQGSPTTGAQAGSIERNRTVFLWQTQVSDLEIPQVSPPADPRRVHKVVVTVRWDHGIGRRDVSLAAILGERRRP